MFCLLLCCASYAFPRSEDGLSLRTFVSFGFRSLSPLLFTVYYVEGESTPVESPAVITCLCVSGRPSLRGIPVELLGWCFHVQVIELEAQACGGMSEN